MDVALLNVRIMIQENQVVTDEIGNHKNTWSDYYSCFATVSNESQSEDTSAGVVIDNSKIDFTIRWCRLASQIDAEHFRIRYAGEIYNILGIDHMNFKKRSIKLKCQKVRR